MNSSTGGYDFKFVDKVSEEFICPICLLVLKDPHLTGCCGHHFCETCITKIKTDSKACPLCNQRCFTTLVDKSVLRKVNNLLISCCNKGCRWAGPLSAIENHLQTQCSYTRIYCDLGCEVKVFRCFLKTHKEKYCSLRPFLCEHCGHEGSWLELTSKHHQVCPKFPVLCPNHCGGDMIRMDVNSHLATTCPLAVVPCKFDFAGCSQTMCRRDIVAHLEDEMVSHLSLLAETCLKLKRDSEAKDEKIAQLELLLRKHDSPSSNTSSAAADWPYQSLPNSNMETCVDSEMVALLDSQSPNDKDSQNGTSLSTVDILLSEHGLAQNQPVAEFIMEDVARYAEDNTTWYTEPFYTHRNGYLFTLGISASRKHVTSRFRWTLPTSPSYFISAYAYLTPGNNDENLRWPFRGDLYLSFYFNNNDIVKSAIIFNARAKPRSSPRPRRRRNTSGEGCVVTVNTDVDFNNNLHISIDKIDVRFCCIHPR